MRYIMEASDRDTILKNLEELEKQLRSLEDILAKGPVAWMYSPPNDGRCHPSAFCSQSQKIAPTGWTESPLYFIPVPEPKS